MGKSSGLGDKLFIDGVDLSGDIGSLAGIRTGIAMLDVTGIDKKAHERIAGHRDGALSFVAFFNKTIGTGSHKVLSTLPTIDRITSYCRGSTIGSQGAGLVAKQLNYDPDRADDGSLTLKIDEQANGYGLEWGIQHTAAPRTDTTGTNGTGVDAGASSAFGLQAYLHVSSVVGTSVTVKLQQSSDDAGTDPYADVVGGGFAAVTVAAAPTAQRIATAAGLTVKRWLRVVTTGTFTSAVFHVIVIRNPIATAF
jgi:hypothetical protein